MDLKLEDRDRPIGGSAPAPDRQLEAITFASLLKDGVAGALGVNSRWLRTLSGLVINAGVTVGDYVSGMRERYSHPVAYVLGCVTAYVVTRRFLAVEGSIFDPIHIVGTVLPYIAIPLLIPSALVMSALFRKLRLGAAECYVLVLYVAAQIALLETGLTVILHLGAPSWLTWIARAVEALYAVQAVVQFTGERRWHGWLRGVLVLATGTAAIYGALYGIVAYVWRGIL